MKFAVGGICSIRHIKAVKISLLCLLVTIVNILTAYHSHAGTTVSLLESYAGNISFQLTGGSFRTTSNNQSACTYGNSSSNPLTTIPASATIEKAYLYWAASAQNSNAGSIDTQVTLNNSYTANASRTYTEFTGDWHFYSAVADVTNYVKNNRNTTYTVSNMSIYSTQAHCTTQTMLGGWALMVIYEDDAEDFRVLNLYEGFQYFQKDFNPSLTLSPSNFKLPANPSGKHAHITWEGDDTIGGDGEHLYFEGVELTNSSGGNSSGNQFDSYSNIEGGLTTYGVDIDAYDISSYLMEGDTNVSTTYTAGQDGVLLSAEIISVSNIPVADLSVSTSNPTGWLQGSTITKKLTISNAGPNDVPAQSTRFTTTLPSQLSFNGIQGDSDWSCSQAGQNLSCIYQPKLRSGWSDYLDLKFDIANGTANQTINWSMDVDHDTAPYDIFDNHEPNNTFTLSVPIVATPAVDFSASSKTYSNLSGDSLLAGDTLQYTITIDDTNNLATGGIQLYDDLPANISGFSIISIPAGAVSNSPSTGGANGTGYLDIQNINLSANSTAEIIFEVYVDSSAPLGASLQNTASINYNSNSWIVDTGEITVVKPDLSPSTIVISDLDGGLFEAGNILNVVITLDDKNDIDITGLQVTANIPAGIAQVNVLSIPSGAINNTTTGGANGTGYLDISDISFAAGETRTIQLQLTLESSPNNPEGTVFNMSSLLTLGSTTWTITSNSLEVVDGTAATTGNKQLYINTASTISRLRPADGTTDIYPETQRSWVLAPVLQSDLTFDLTDIAIETKVEGNRNGTTWATITFTLSDTDGLTLASKTLTNVSIRSGRIDAVTTTLNKNSALTDMYTVPAGKGLVLTIRNDGFNGSTSAERRLTLHILDGIDNTLKADGYSAVIINASTVINVDSINVWSAPFNDTNGDFIDDSGATLITNSQPDTTLSVRATVSDPFGAFDINSAEFSIKKFDGSDYSFSGSTTANMAAIDDPSDNNNTLSKIFEGTFTLAEVNEIINGWTISVTAKEGVEGDIEHTGIKGFTVLPFLPNIAITKSVDVTYDPVNGYKSLGNKPKAIPDAELIYTINAVNTGRGASDNNSIKLQDEIPVDSELFLNNLACNNRGPGTGAGPICFQDGTAPNESNLTYNFTALNSLTDHVRFSQDGIDFDYEPEDLGDGYDPTIRYIRITPSGNFKQSDKNNTYSPEFTFSYQVRLK